MIDKKNSLWKWKKPTKEFKSWYKKNYGLEADEIGLMTEKGFDMYINLISPPLRVGEKGVL